MITMSAKILPKLFLIYDNRIVPSVNFQVEAASIAYHRYMTDFVEKILFINQTQFQSCMIAGIGVAASPTTIKIVTPNEFSILPQSLEARFSSLGGNLAPSQTWSGIFTDALRQVLAISQLQNHPQYNFENNTSETIIIFYSTDLNMIGSESAGAIAEGIKVFVPAFSLTRNALRNVRIKFAAVELLDGMYSKPKETNKFALHSEIFSKIKEAQFHNLPNSSLVFEEEIKVICGACCPKYCVTLELPPCHNIKLDVKLQLHPANFDAIQDLQYISNLESCGILQNTMIDATYLAGHSIKIFSPEEQFKFQLQMDDLSIQNNQILLGCIRDWLDKNNLVLLIRAPFDHAGSVVPCYKYWVLVPSRRDRQEKLVMVMLADRDDILENDGKLGPVDVPVIEELQTYDEFMQFLDDSKEFWGDPTLYNPWIYSSGLFNAKFAEYGVHMRSNINNPYIRNQPGVAATKPPQTNSYATNQSISNKTNVSTSGGRGGGRNITKDTTAGRGRGGKGNKNAYVPNTSPMNIQPKVAIPAIVDLSDDGGDKPRVQDVALARNQLEQEEAIAHSIVAEQKASRSKYLRRKFSDAKPFSNSWIEEEEFYNP